MTSELDHAITTAALAFLPAQYRATISLIYVTPCTCEDVAKHLNTSNEYARKILTKLHKLKVACAVSWRRTGRNGMPTKVWGLGEKDARPPEKLTRSQISKRHRDSKRIASGSVRLGVWGL